MTTPELRNLLVADRLNERYREAATERLAHRRALRNAPAGRPGPRIRVHVRRRLGWLSSAI